MQLHTCNTCNNYYSNIHIICYSYHSNIRTNDWDRTINLTWTLVEFGHDLAEQQQEHVIHVIFSSRQVFVGVPTRGRYVLEVKTFHEIIWEFFLSIVLRAVRECSVQRTHHVTIFTWCHEPIKFGQLLDFFVKPEK